MQIYIDIGSLIGEFIGFIMIGIALLRINKMGKEHRKISNDDSLSENEKVIQNKTITILKIGFSVIVISVLILALDFLD